MKALSNRTASVDLAWFMQSALIPLVLVETILIACYLLTNQAIRESQVDYLERSAVDSLAATAEQNSRIIRDQLTHIAGVTQLFADMTAHALSARRLPPTKHCVLP
jgi:hypothetical protein